MNYFIDEIQNALHALNGCKGEPENYIYWALLVTNATNPEFDIFPPSELIVAKEVFDSKISEINIGC